MRSAARNGDGSSDYALVGRDLLSFYRRFAASGKPVYFAEAFAVYSFQDGLPVYSQGKVWESYDARILSVSETAAEVPEPGTLPLAGLCALLASRYVRRRRTVMQ